jgi:uncharacterized protein (TIGR03545 family)
MIRWRFFISRIILMLLAVLALWLAAAPILHLALQRGLQSAIGARVDIDQLQIGWLPPRLMVRSLAVADPDRDRENLIRTGRILAQLDGLALLHGRFVITDARIEQLEFSTERMDSGRLPPAEPVVSPADERSWTGQLIGNLVEKICDQAETQAKTFADELASPRTAKEIGDRWQTQLRSLREQTAQLKQTVQAIKASARTVENPLRDLPTLEQALRDALSVRQQVIALRDAANAIPQQLQYDWQTIDQARRDDQQRLSELAGVPLDQISLDGRWLIAVARAQFDQLRPHLEMAQQVADATVVPPKPARCRGQDIDFHRGPRLPDVFCQHCEISGRISHARQDYQLTGTVQNFSWDTARLGANELPIITKLNLTGPHALQVNYYRHFETSPRTDILRIHWPAVPAQVRRLGDDRKVAVSISAAPLDVWLDLSTQGTKIDGRLMVRQPAVEVTAQGSERFARLGMIDSLNRGLASIDRFELDARVQGDWNDPRFAVSSNLEAALRNGFRTAANEQWSRLRQQAIQEIEGAHQRATTELQTWIGEQHAALQQELALVQNLVNDATNQLTELQRPQFYLGKLRGQNPQR